MAKITITTDKAGRKVYKVAGTKKYAYSMAKAKEIASKESGTAKRAPVGVRVSKKKPSAAAAKKYAAFEAKLVSSVINDVKGGLAGYKDAARFFKHDPYAAADFYGINEDYVSPAFTRAVLRELKYEIDDLEHLRKEDRAIAAARKSGKLPALRGSGKTTKPKRAARKKPMKVLGRSIESALKIVRTKGRDLKATPAHRKELVAKYRKALQKAGYLR